MSPSAEGARDDALVTSRWSMPGVDDPPDESVSGTPVRRTSSIRRTAHLSATFPGGFGTAMLLTGRARDLLTSHTSKPEVVAEYAAQLELDPTRTITSASVEPDHPGAVALVGSSGGRGYRAALAAAIPEHHRQGSALYFLLDDVAIISGIGGVAWSQHRPMVIPDEGGARKREGSWQRTTSGRVACSGLRPGGYHQISWQRSFNFPHWIRIAGDLDDTADEWAWHDIEPAPEVCFRRRRRIDVWRSSDGIEVDAHFRDSVYGRAQVEVALHEYGVVAVVHPDSHLLLSIEATSKVLPFPECPWAAPHADKLVGQPVTDFRASVPNTVTELEACTHLNDMLRGLADVPALAAALA